MSRGAYDGLAALRAELAATPACLDCGEPWAHTGAGTGAGRRVAGWARCPGGHDFSVYPGLFQDFDWLLVRVTGEGAGAECPRATKLSRSGADRRGVPAGGPPPVTGAAGDEHPVVRTVAVAEAVVLPPCRVCSPADAAAEHLCSTCRDRGIYLVDSPDGPRLTLGAVVVAELAGDRTEGSASW